MKRKLSLILGFVLLLSLCFCVPASAAEDETPQAQTEQSSGFIYVPFGQDPASALKLVPEKWAFLDIHFPEDPVVNTITLSDGTNITEQIFTGTGRNFSIENRYYYTSDEKAIAGVQDIVIPEDVNIAEFINQLTKYYGEPGQLSIEDLGLYAEILGEAAHLENGQKVWNYTAKITSTGADSSEASEVRAILAMRIIDGHVYLAECPNPNPAAETAGALNLTELNGFDQLTEEEKKAVSQYAEFLAEKQKHELEDYIDYLVKKHQ